MGNEFIKKISGIFNRVTKNNSNQHKHSDLPHNTNKINACNSTSKSTRTDNHELKFGYLNINNSIKNKFELLTEQVKGNIDVLMISEIKIGDSFTVDNLLIDRFWTSCRLDRNLNGGGILLYVREDIPSFVC